MSATRYLRPVVAVAVMAWTALVGATASDCGMTVKQDVCVTVDGSGDCSTPSDTEDGDTGGDFFSLVSDDPNAPVDLTCGLAGDCTNAARACVTGLCMIDPTRQTNVCGTNQAALAMKVLIDALPGNGTRQWEDFIADDTCFIDNQCWAPGDKNPANDCLECDPGSSKKQWSNRDMDAACDTPTTPGGGQCNSSPTTNSPVSGFRCRY
jgi:hypothetical protein